MDMKFCQSCGMPLSNDVMGTNAGGTPNEDYCIYCYKAGKFTQDMTMEQMIDHCAQFNYAAGDFIAYTDHDVCSPLGDKRAEYFYRMTKEYYNALHINRELQTDR